LILFEFTSNQSRQLELDIFTEILNYLIIRAFMQLEQK